MLVLGIESTCDETACAVVREGTHILSNIVASQIDLHKEYGGVVPELACRRHIDLIMPVLQQALQQAQVSMAEIDLIAVAHGPGLIGALLIGLNTAKALAFAHQKPFIGINHIEAHLYAALMSHGEPVSFPCLGVVLSGGHTALVLMKEIGVYQLIGQTVDDAIGEAFDKVAKMLGLPYPGGPQIERLARAGKTGVYTFKAGQVKGRPFDFSFSGLKTAVLYTLKGPKGQQPLENLSMQEACNLAAAFQQAALEDVVKKTLAAADRHQVRTILFGGGVTNNQRLRELFNQANPHQTYIWPSVGLSLDNAAMIAGLGYHRYAKQGAGDPLSLEPLVRIPFV
ncbi:tRNA (adenosine(37)-N6)-threonylcarbamoyltransferase complex transferase subunit TsaD [Candidatus Protochlamydia phocaeensis]|uniref:tRNA (adenosine(37)-N6)-threonylcarbamoyltransferase complex transferase subunit TsaD n=1 Tax=Candidatus Protochlamydia phocaeensis TaxID=1414722 RepID=UPI0008393CE9|nr:tRNA (adenosine(37)-N6)-threonylcarbamoyltransferase complex transferase subunit TsaD [Candidatus Protochlamydia phocaeensis]